MHISSQLRQQGSLQAHHAHPAHRAQFIVRTILSAIFVVAMGACGGATGCSACGAAQPLPGGKLPADQTVEGGAQIRITPAGFNKLTSILPGLLNSQLGGGFCVPQGEVGDSTGFLGTGASYCGGNSGMCSNSCKVNVALNTLTPTVTNQQTLNLAISTTVSSTIPISGQVLGVGFSCNLGVSSPDLGGNLDIKLGIDPATGELDVHLGAINSLTLNLDFSGCGPLSSIGNFASTVIDSFVGQFLVSLLTPAIDNILQGFLPHPLGIAGVMDAGALVGGISPGTKGALEARIVPGGYVNLIRNGLSLGVITGLNADEDPTTRGPGLASEPALCVPPLAPIDFAAAPANLPRTARTTFALGVANEFNGTPGDPANTDVAMGISETTLDLAGHHMVTSGLMCLGIGTSYISMLNVGTISILVPSLADLQSPQGNDPLLLVTRPQRALDFRIGNNTVADPALTIGIDHLEVDFYAFLYERYTRVFTMDLSLNVGVNFEIEQPAGMPAQLKPSLVGISSMAVTVKALNTQFVSETPAELEARIPTVFDLVTPLLGNLPAIPLPAFAGFTLQDLSIKKVTTSQDDFLAIYAKLGASAFMRQLAQTDPFAATAVADLDAAIPAAGAPSTAHAKLRSVRTPDAGDLLATLDGKRPGGMPEVAFDVDASDAAGHALEWSYNLNGGMWHAYRAPTATGFVIADPAFAWQGVYTIGLKSRVVGDYHTTSGVTQVDVTIDSVPPQIFVDHITNPDDDTMELPLFDIVSGKNVQYAFSQPGSDDEPTTWISGNVAKLTRAQAAPFLVDGELAIHARDRAGNRTVALVKPFHGAPTQAGCACDATNHAPSPGGLLLVVIVGGALAIRRRRRARRIALHFARWAGLSVAVSMFPACSCGDAAEQTACETVEDCAACPDGQLAFCVDHQCKCQSDLPPGRIGPYSDVAVAPDGTIWVSAYAESYGDLVVAKSTGGRIPDESWEWVDGIPDGPIAKPGSAFRHGVTELGEDVGMYTSIAVSQSGEPMVTYFDRDTASLRFAMKVGDTWQKHVIDTGTGSLTETGGVLVGMYSSISLRSDDGRPGVAYLAHIADAAGQIHAEVRYVAAQTPTPTSAADWTMWVVDSAPLELDPSDIYPLPQGMGLFIDAARMPNQAPVIAYYDRANGDLKLAKFDPQLGQFAAPLLLDGSMGDAGWSPSVAVDAAGAVHVAYVSASEDDLQFITVPATGPISAPELVDDGYRVVGQTVDNLPKPEFHFVGDDATLVMAGNVPMIAYQDATTQELLLATKQGDGTWTRESIAGHTDPWAGAYGFFASAAPGNAQIIMSSWVIDQPTEENWVEVFQRATQVQ